RHFGDVDHALSGDEGRGVAVGVEADAGLRDVIEHDGIGTFGEHFFASGVDAGVGFGGEGDDKGAGTMRVGDLAEDVSSGLEVEVQSAFAAELFGGYGGHA